MPSYVTPKINTAFVFYVALVSQADTKLLKANPTLAAGDAQVSTGGGAFGNLATLPDVDPDAGYAVKVSLSAAEMNGDNIQVIFHDAAGAEWCDLLINIQTTARQIDDLAWPTTTGRSVDVTATGEVGIDWANIGGPTTAVALSGTTIASVSVKKNTALANLTFLMVLSSDHVTSATGKAITAEISQDGGAFGACTNAVAEIGSGLYKITLTAAEMNADIVVLKFTNVDCDQRTITMKTSP